MSERVRPHPEGDRARDSRSRSPGKHLSPSHRTRSPQRNRRKHKRSHVEAATSKALPYDSRSLTKRDYDLFKPMFGLYLDIQKGKILEDMDEVELKGRWKSFMGKWNRGELAEGWYDPLTLQKALQSSTTQSDGHSTIEPRRSNATTTKDPLSAASQGHAAEQDSESDSDDSVGPALPGQELRKRGQRKGPRIPNMQDLELKREMETEDGLARRDDIRYERKLDRKEQKAALDELVPRAEAGTRERQLEKKKEVNEKMKSFRERSPGAVEVPDAELMGGGDGVDGYKKQKQDFERKKNERELRKEEFLRARMAEREERLQEYKLKEDSTMAMLKALAKQNFG